MFLTTPSRTSPSCSWETSSVRCSARASSRIARRETTMLPRGRSILRRANGCSLPISGPTSRTGRMSTWLPGRKAEAPPRSTVKPPFTRPTMEPITGSFLANTTSRRVQASSRGALSRRIPTSAQGVFNALQEDFHGIADLDGGLAVFVDAEFLHGDAAFGLQTDVDDGEVLFNA